MISSKQIGMPNQGTQQDTQLDPTSQGKLEFSDIENLETALKQVSTGPFTSIANTIKSAIPFSAVIATFANNQIERFKTYTPEKSSHRNFLPRYIINDGASAKNEQERAETMAGGSGVWGYQLDIEPTNISDIDFNEMAQKVSQQYIDNQKAIFDIYLQERSKRKYNVPFDFRDRLLPQNIHIWETLLSKRVHPENKGAYKDMDMIIKDDDSAPRDNPVPCSDPIVDKVTDEYISTILSDIYIKANKTVKVVFGTESLHTVENNQIQFILEVVEKDKLEEKRQLAQLAEDKNISKIYFVRDGYNIVSVEQWNNHYNSNEEQGRRIFESILDTDNIIPRPIDLLKINILRENKIEDEYIYDTEYRLEISKEKNEEINRVLEKFKPRMALSTFLVLSELITNKDAFSGYVCVQTDRDGENTSAELQMALVPKPNSIVQLHNFLTAIDNKITDESIPEFIKIYLKTKNFKENFSEVNQFVDTDIAESKLGKGILSILFVTYPQVVKNLLSTIFRKTGKSLQKGSVQVSSVPIGSMKFNMANFITALNSTVDTGISVKRTDHNTKILSIRKRIKSSEQLSREEIILRCNDERDNYLNNIDILIGLLS